MQQTPKSERTPRLAGFTLVELMVSLFIVGIVMMGWWRIINATSPYREAQRRAAVEVAAGFLDVFPINSVASGTFFEIQPNGQIIARGLDAVRYQFPAGCLPPDSPIQYSLSITSVLPSASDWRRWRRTSGSSVNYSRWWAKMQLYDGQDVNLAPFATFEQLVYTQ